MREHLITDTATVKEALSRLNALSGRNMTLFVCSETGKLTGSLTDGDIRRALMRGKMLETVVAHICNRDCLRIEGAETRYKITREAKKRGITLIPITNAEGSITDIADMSMLKALLPLDAVLMAGGRGERLRPLTLHTPKPLLPVGGRPIIDYNIESLVLHGVSSISVTVNYLKEQIENHFKKPVNYGGRTLQVECVAEPTRLGTMGSLSLIEGLTQDDIIVMNSDLLTSIDLATMFEQHKSSGAYLTMGAIPYTVNVPFAILDTDKGEVKRLQEKPTYNYLANAGVYMMKREVAWTIPKGEYLDAPDLIETLLRERKKVGYFPIEGTWIDIGSPSDFARAEALLTHK